MEYFVMFLNSISILERASIEIEDFEFKQIINGFIENFYFENKEIMNKVFNIHATEDGKIVPLIDYSDAERFGNVFYENPKLFAKMYDDIGDKDVDKITFLAKDFLFYVDLIYNSYNSRVKG